MTKADTGPPHGVRVLWAPGSPQLTPASPPLPRLTGPGPLPLGTGLFLPQAWQECRVGLTRGRASWVTPRPVCGSASEAVPWDLAQPPRHGRCTCQISHIPWTCSAATGATSRGGGTDRRTGWWAMAGVLGPVTLGDGGWWPASWGVRERKRGWGGDLQNPGTPAGDTTPGAGQGGL